VRATFVLVSESADARVWRYLAYAAALVLASSLIVASAPALLKLLVDRFATEGSDRVPWLLLALYVTALSLSRLLSELRWLVFGIAEQRLHRRLGGRLFEHVIRLPIRFHLDHKAGMLNQTLANGLQGYRWILQHSVFSILPVVAELAAMAAVLIYFDQPVFLAILAVSLIAYAVTFSVGVARSAAPARDVSGAQVAASATMTDYVVNCEAVKYYCAENQARQHCDDALGITENSWIRFYKRRATSGMAISLVFALSLGLTLVIAARAVLTGAMTVGAFVLVNAYLLQMVRLLESIGLAIRDISQGVAFVDKMLGLLDRPPEEITVAANGRSSASSTGSSLFFDRVNFSYDPGRPILRDVSFSVQAGTTVAVVGGSGSGKSTLLRLVTRLYEPDSGRILLDGAPISLMPLPALRRSIAVVPQETVLFHESIAYNIGLGAYSPEEVERAARIASIHALAEASPQGYRTVVGERGLKLSGGEKQRIAIARAVLRDPGIFVFDEATSSLDSPTEQAILNNLRQISRGRTTLIIAHRLSTILHADEIIVLSRGSIVEHGDHRTLMRNGGPYAAIWQAQVQGDIVDCMARQRSYCLGSTGSASSTPCSQNFSHCTLRR
jgi:ATP-binding cassette subfamily B protein